MWKLNCNAVITQVMDQVRLLVLSNNEYAKRLKDLSLPCGVTQI